jgi:alkylation response protein AidB-like acyl-CoA dehydrogenase
MEEQLRHAIAPPIYGGTNEIQRGIIARSLGLR